MTQPPQPPGSNHHDPQQSGHYDQWITGSSQSAGRPEETQQLPPYGQSSAGNPYTQPYGQQTTQPPAQPPTQPTAQPPTQPTTQPWGQPPAGQPAPSAFGSWQPQPAQQPQFSQSKRFADANPLRAAFDFSFKQYATPGIAKIVYVAAIVLGLVWWIGGSIYWFRLASEINHLASSLSGPLGGGGGTGNPGGAFNIVGILSLVLGWIPVLLGVFLVRVFLEAAIAMTRTADDARHIRQKVEE